MTIEQGFSTYLSENKIQKCSRRSRKSNLLMLQNGVNRKVNEEGMKGKYQGVDEVILIAKLI